MKALATTHDAVVQVIDMSVVRVHQHGACSAGNRERHRGHSRGGLTSKVHALVDGNGLPVRLGLTPGETDDNRLCPVLLAGLRSRTMLSADRGYDADWIRAYDSHGGLGQHSSGAEPQGAHLLRPLPRPNVQLGRAVLQ